MNFYRYLNPSAFLFTALFAGSLCAGSLNAQSAASLVVDDFENGVASWSRNDKQKATGSVATLADIVPTSPTGGAPGSKGAALLAFKTGRGSWASVSRRVDGAAWSAAGGQRLTFWLDSGGETQGVNLQLRGRYAAPGGKFTELVFSLPRPVRLDIQRWRKVVIPLADFKGPKGELLSPRLPGVYLLSLAQTGDWDSRFFSMDDLVVEGTGVPLNQPAPIPAPNKAPVVAPTPGTGSADNKVAGSASVAVDFLKLGGAIKASGNITLGGSYSGSTSSPVETSAAYRQYLAMLKPRFVKINAAELCELTDSSRPAFDYSRLVATTARVRSWKSEPLISLSNPAEWGLDGRGFAAFALGAAQALNKKGAPRALFFELATVEESYEDNTAVNYYNAGYSSLKSFSSKISVGGFGAYAGNPSLVGALLKGARGLDFMTVSFFGAVSGLPADEVVLAAAREVTSLKTAAGLLDKSRYKNSPLFVTASNLSAARNQGDTIPSDIRLVQAISAAWWGQYLASGSRLADQVFHNDGVNAEWGLLDSNANAYPAFYTLWMWNTYFAGSTRVAATSDRPEVFVAAANTKTAHNMLLVNTTAQEQTAQVSIRGFPVLREARIRIFDDPQKPVAFTSLPKSPYQTVKLAPYAVAVLQFIEPPKRP